MTIVAGSLVRIRCDCCDRTWPKCIITHVLSDKQLYINKDHGAAVTDAWAVLLVENGFAHIRNKRTGAADWRRLIRLQLVADSDREAAKEQRLAEIAQIVATGSEEGEDGDTPPKKRTRKKKAAAAEGDDT